MLLMLTGDKDKDSKLERLYKEYKNIMFYVANNILHDNFLAEDAVHQSFVKICNSLHKIDEPDCRKTRNFLVIICKHVAIDMYNTGKKQVEDELNENISSHHDIVSDIVISNDNMDKFGAIVKELNPIYQEVIFLRFFRDFSVEEISAMKNISKKTVQKRIERARKQLLELLGKEGELNG